MSQTARFCHSDEGEQQQSQSDVNPIATYMSTQCVLQQQQLAIFGRETRFLNRRSGARQHATLSTSAIENRSHSVHALKQHQLSAMRAGGAHSEGLGDSHLTMSKRCTLIERNSALAPSVLLRDRTRIQLQVECVPSALVESRAARPRMPASTSWVPTNAVAFMMSVKCPW